MDAAAPQSGFDLAAYLDRVGLAAPPAATAAGLAELHLAHATHIPFENLDVLLGRPVRLDLDSLQRKLVRDRRGGYCFEQNTLLAAALEAVGFRVTRFAARVRFGATRKLPRTHMLLAVEADGREWLADVGFGGGGPLLPLRLDEPGEQRQFHWSYRIAAEGGARVLRSARPTGWQDLYVFTPEPQEAADYEVANYYVSTHPDSPFTRTLAIQFATPEVRYMLRNRELTVERADGAETRVVVDDELPELLSKVFGLALPPDATLPDRPWVWGRE